MTNDSNTTSYATKTADYPAVAMASGLAINSDTTIVAGDTNASIITDILIRNTGSQVLAIDVFIGSTATSENNVCRISIPANSGNNGSTAIASLAALVPALFDLDLAGNRVLTLESGVTIYFRNIAALTNAFYVRVKRRNF